MQQETSCGAVVFTDIGNERRFVIVRGKKGFYGFPKGHMEAGETEKETALREIQEETGLHVQIIDGFRTEDEHPLIREGKPDAIKKIIYFAAAYEAQEPQPQESEITEIRLLTFSEAMEAFQFDSSKRILNEAADFLREKQIHAI